MSEQRINLKAVDLLFQKYLKVFDFFIKLAEDDFEFFIAANCSFFAGEPDEVDDKSKWKENQVYNEFWCKRIDVQAVEMILIQDLNLWMVKIIVPGAEDVNIYFDIDDMESAKDLYTKIKTWVKSTPNL